MKRLLFTTIILISSVSVWGQRYAGKVYSTGSEDMDDSQVSLPEGKSWEAKHFREALLRGREYKGYYVLVNEDKKTVKVEPLIEFCKAHNYRWNEKYETKEISKFGDKATSVYKFRFIPNSQYVQYVFEWTDRFQKRGDDLMNKGTVYFFDPSINRFLCLEKNALWSGGISEGYVDGTGAGIWQKDNRTFYYFCGTFQKGFPVGKAKYRIIDVESNVAWGYSPREKMSSGKAGTGTPFREVEVGEMHDGMALFRYLDNGEGKSAGKPNELYGYVKENGDIAISPKYKTAFDFDSGRAAVKNEKGEDVYINKTGQFIDYTEKQKRIFAEEKARQDSLKAAEERARLLAEKKAEEERRAAEAKEADLKRRIEVNKNTKLWSRGCRLCYRYPNGYEYVLATLEEWNESRTKVKVKIVASPSSTRTLNGDLLEKNNTIWVSARNEGWHLALDEEISIALKNDNSIKRPQVVHQVQQVSTPKDPTCKYCNGRGTRVCNYCNGSGIYSDIWRTHECYSCDGKGWNKCSWCNGRGRTD